MEDTRGFGRNFAQESPEERRQDIANIEANTDTDFGTQTVLPDELLNEDNDSLTEDMFQADYPNNYVIDVGWYLGVNKFRIYVIKDSNWEEPVLRIDCGDINTLNSRVEECINFVRNKI